ncbi:DUF169 domain-containing protein [Methanospirillum stamsii]|uniref:DUF169 domain-containing protein n=1 Tax=Methanospirillum stamsii TaxID=1277351 RepID=A0A2V2NF86_9EURY|nr:DUF169 domain-containing protein [Methanospirillum stamsii]PWR76226.1 hypothetical protein DLD82_00700 [Methanospirillum stamsii]
MVIKSEIANKAGIKTEPVAIVWSDTKPEDALEIRPGTWACLMWYYAKAARDGKVSAISRNNFGCSGGAMGIGFGRPFEKHSSGNEENFCCFLSNGRDGSKNKDAYDARLNTITNPHQKEMLKKGERILKNPSITKEFLNSLPFYDVPTEYVLFKPLSSTDPNEVIKSIIFLVNPDQLSVLSILANYHRGQITDSVIVAAGAAGCQAIGVCTYNEENSDNPHAIVGLTDLMARKSVRRTLGSNILTFSVPYKLFLEMEANVPGSILESELWIELRDEK